MTYPTLDINDPTPIACSLSAAKYRQRVGDAGALARNALRAREPITGGARLHFADAPGVRQRLEGFVAAESACCPFLTMNLSRHGERLVLDVTGPSDAQAIIAALFS